LRSWCSLSTRSSPRLISSACSESDTLVLTLLESSTSCKFWSNRRRELVGAHAVFWYWYIRTTLLWFYITKGLIDCFFSLVYIYRSTKNLESFMILYYQRAIFFRKEVSLLYWT
jgi:hypothetical protein